MSEEKKPDTIGICKVCQEKKVRNPAGKFSNGRDTKFVDAEGMLWNGKTCPKCHGEKMRKHQQVKRSKLNLQ